MDGKELHLGLDLGSISLKAALIDGSGEVLFGRWTRVAGAPREALASLLGEIEEAFPGALLHSVGATGSGRGLLVEAIDAVEVNEITAQAAACAARHPEVRSIVEIGGQDSKLIILDEANPAGIGAPRAISHFAMNELCAAGTGAFLDQQAARLCLSIEEFARLALEATDPVPIAGRCAVFAKSDMTHHQQEGRSLPDIVAGLCEALARSYSSNMIRGRELPRPVSFQGGVAANEGLARAFRKILSLPDGDLIVPEHYKIMGAIGAAIVASRAASKRASFNPVRIAEALACAPRTTREPAGSSVKEGKKLKATASERGSLEFRSTGLDGTYLGIDIGSVSVKIAAVSPEGVVHQGYRFSDGKPLEALRELLSDERLRSIEIRGAATTGSGRRFFGKLLRADAEVNEITAQAKAASMIMPGVDTVVEIGGQDAKFLRLEGERASHFAMNRVCAAGTGAFLQEQAARLAVDLEGEFSREAFAAENPARLGNRCTVFMESDLVAHQQQGATRGELCAGLARSVVTNYLEKVAAGHPPGKRILFLGGVAENPAVAAALGEELGAPVATSPYGRVSGAIGAALIAFEKRRGGLYSKSSFSPHAADLPVSQFACEECPNRCSVTRIGGGGASPEGGQGADVFFGGRCGRWDGAARRRSAAQNSPLKRRIALVDSGRGKPAPKTSPRAKRIGMPRALFAFDRLPEWRAFFEGIGCEVVVSPPSNDDMFAEGMRRLVVENCLPVKALSAHIAWLDLHGGVDFIFVPSLVNTGEDRFGKETVHCPYIQGARQFAVAAAKTPLISPSINWRWNPSDEEEAMLSQAAALRVDAGRARVAFRKAKEVGDALRKEIRSMGEAALKSLAEGKIPRAFLLIGKDYNILDMRLNSRAPEILESMGETVITQDMLCDDSGLYSEAWRTMCWSHGKEILAAAEIAAKTPGLYPVFITSFGCGPDSFTVKAVRDIMGEKPMLLLEVDEHSSSVGAETRIEAFIDALPRKAAARGGAQRPAFKPPQGIKAVYLPNFSDHSLAFAAAIAALGFEPRLTPLPDDESARLGSARSTNGECHPYALMLGDYLKVARGGGDLSRACYFMPESGACRVGLFGTQMRLVAEEEGSALPIFTRIEELAPSVAKSSRSSSVKAVSTYWEMMRGMDFFLQQFYETRAHEVTPGSADRARDEARAAIWKRIMDGRALEGLREAREILSAVAVDMSRPRVRIGITGDYYTRICDYANGDIFRDIERMGGVVMLPPTMSEFVKYDSHKKPMGMLRHRRLADAAQALVMRGLVGIKERRVREIFGDSISYDVPLEYDRAMELIAPYMDDKLPAGLSGSIAAILEQIEAGADGILNIITFHCSYGLVIGAALAGIDRDHPLIPKLTLIFEGLKPTHNRTRLEAFMERVKEKFDSRRAEAVGPREVTVAW